jgi:outer membrane protein OmpA-like peptidoglycan-associated protein
MSMRNVRKVPIVMMAILFAVLVSSCRKVEDPQASPAAPSAQPSPASAPASAPTPTAAPSGAIRSKLPGGEIVNVGDQISIGFILWGGDMPTFYGNGGLETRTGTIFAEYNLHAKLFAADDTATQINDYKSGKTNFLRMTAPTISRYLADLCPVQNADLCPEIAFQMTWSAGDHLVCREKITDLKQLKDMTIAIQKAGPHESFLFDVLRDVGLKISDVKIVWANSISADPKKSDPPNMLRDNPNVDCAFAVSPDMIALTGGLTSKGTGAEGSVKGARVLVSTADRRKSIPDVYYVSHAFNAKNPDVVRRFTAAYLKSVEKVTALRHDYEDKNKGSEELRGLLAFAMQVNDTWKGACPSEGETFGLLQDASFVGLAGNVEWFNPLNQTGNKYFSDLSNDLAAALSVTTVRAEVLSANVDWSHAIFNGFASGNVQRTPRFNAEATTAQIEKLNQTGALAENRMLSFVAYFEENQVEFDETKYGAQFDEVITLARKYTRAPIVIRGHTDTTLLVSTILRKGMAMGLVKQAGTTGNFSYSINGSPLDINNAKQVLGIMGMPGINDTDPTKNTPSPSRIAEAATALSRDRANQVRNALIAYAAKKGVTLDQSQINIVGAGASDPFIVKPRSVEEAAKNRRVEFSIVRVTAEAATNADYEL